VQEAILDPHLGDSRHCFEQLPGRVELVDADEDADPDAPEDDWSAMLASQTPPAPAVRPLDPAVERLRAELAEIRRKREGLASLLMDDFDRLGVPA